MDQTVAEAEGYFGAGGILFFLVIAALLVIPYWKLWQRTGRT